MDYGQSVNNPNENPFFTAGVGNASEQFNPDPSGSLNSNSYRNLRDVGNAAISSSGQNIEPAQQNTPFTESSGPNSISQFSPEEIGAQNQELGQIVNLEMPPETESLNSQNQGINELDALAIKTEKRLSKSAIRVVDDAKNKFMQDGDAADFYRTTRDMMETNLENSYNRKLAA